MVVCFGCGRQFTPYKYTKSKVNFCSSGCYRWYTKRKHTKICQRCGKSFEIKDYLVKQGFGYYCSNKCFQAVREEKRIKLNCKKCGKTILKSPSVAVKTVFCSKKCADDFMRDYVSRICRNCNKVFELPTWEINKGKGSFCSRRCYIHFKGETSIEKIVKDYFINNHIEFDQEVCFGKYHSDFQIKGTNILIECDGSYWHSIPGAKEKDKKKDEILKNKGYQVFRFSEEEIKNSKGECLNQLVTKNL